MANAIALIGFNDLGSWVTPTFLFRKRFHLQLSPHCPKMNKKSMWEVEKFEDFRPRDMESCHFAAARRVKLWSLNANLFFEELRQLTRLIGPFKPYLTENISLQSSNSNTLGLAATVAFLVNEARFIQI